MLTLMKKLRQKWRVTDTNGVDIILLQHESMELKLMKGQRIHYYSENGIVYIDIAKNEIRTAFSSDEFDEKIKSFLEVLSKNE